MANSSWWVHTASKGRKEGVDICESIPAMANSIAAPLSAPRQLPLMLREYRRGCFATAEGMWSASSGPDIGREGERGWGLKGGRGLEDGGLEGEGGLEGGRGREEKRERGRVSGRRNA